MKETNKFYRFFSFFVSRPIRFFNRIKVYGTENIPKDGGVIVCANHIAAKDVFLIGASCPRPIRFIAKKELFAIPIVRGFIKMLGAIKLDRGGNDVAAIRKSIELLQSGEAVAIFPQGHRNPGKDPGTTQIKSGTALLASKSQCNILPVFIQTKGNRYRIFRRVNVIFGKVISNSELNLDNPGKSDYKACTEFIFGKVIELGGYKYLSPANKNTRGENEN